MNGGYDAGYQACPCFWGTEPGSLLTRLVTTFGEAPTFRALDAGCGEGKNAVYLANRGASVVAVDLSPWAIMNARALHAEVRGIKWVVGDIASLRLRAQEYDVVVAYGLLHCLPDPYAVRKLVSHLMQATRPGGYQVVCAFNARFQDLRAHPGFSPTLLPHADILSLYDGWDVVEESDRDLVETHPHNNIEHTHSMTRLIVRRPA